MAQLGFRTVDEMIGQVDKLDTQKAVDHWKAAGLDFTKILYKAELRPGDEILPSERTRSRSGSVTRCFTTILPLCQDALENKEPVNIILPMVNTNRTVGTILGS